MYIPSVISRLFFDMDRVVDKLMKCESDTYTLKLAIEYLYGRHDQCESTTDAGETEIRTQRTYGHKRT